MITANTKWREILKDIDFAFQAIVDINTGKTLAFEALLRDFDNSFKSIDHFFDKAYEEKILFGIDIELRKKLLCKYKDIFLFYNLDNRILEMDDYTTGKTNMILQEYGYEKNILTFEISEKHEFKSCTDAKILFTLYKEQNFKVALDDFGTGYSGLKMLYHLNPDFIKIDKFFISDILNDAKKKIYVTNIVNIAHFSNIAVIAEGIETQEEVNVCREIGCDYVQGYFIQKPTQNIKHLNFEYDIKRVQNRSKNSHFNFDLNNIYFNLNEYNNLIDQYIISSATDTKGIITSVSTAFCKISGYSKRELIGKPHNIVRNPSMCKNTFKDMWNTIKKGEIWIGELSNRSKSGEIYWVEAKIIPNYNEYNDITGYTAIRTDLTHKKKLEEYIFKDRLTDCYNRKFFDTKLKEFLTVLETDVA